MKFIELPIVSASTDQWKPPKKMYRDSNWVKLLELCKDYKLNTDCDLYFLDRMGGYRTRLYINGLLTKYRVAGSKRKQIAWKTSELGLKLLDQIEKDNLGFQYA